MSARGGREAWPLVHDDGPLVGIVTRNPVVTYPEEREHGWLTGPGRLLRMKLRRVLREAPARPQAP